MNWRKYHRLISIIIVLPFMIMILSGLLLMVRSKVEVIQPASVKVEKFGDKSLLDFSTIVMKSGVNENEIDQIIFRPEKFQLTLRLKNHEEIHLHPQTGEVLKRAKRWTGFLIDLHQGSFFGELGQFGIFLPAGLGVLFLMISGLILFPRRKNYER